MRRATKTVATWFGISAGIAGLEHGYFEILQGGGIFPPVIGLIGGAAGTRINKPVTDKPAGGLLRLAAKLWPWPLVIFLIWTWGQFVVGFFFNDFLQSVMGFGVLLILVMLPLSAYSAYGHDVVQA